MGVADVLPALQRFSNREPLGSDLRVRAVWRHCFGQHLAAVFANAPFCTGHTFNCPLMKMDECAFVLKSDDL